MSRALAGRSTRRQGNGAAERVKAMVEEKLDAGLEYEALQLYRGQAARKAARGDFDSAAAMAETGAQVLMQRGFADSASELSRQLVEIYKENGCDVTQERLDRIQRLDALYQEVANKGPGELKGKGSEAGIAQARQVRHPVQSGFELQAKFLKAAVAWTAAAGPRPAGDAALNALPGRCLFAMGNAEAGTSRMVAGEQPIELRLLMMGVLHFLALGNLRDANAQRAAWEAAAAPERARGGAQQFVRLLCATCERDAAPLFQRLAEAMRASGDPAVEKHLAQIGRVFFSILPPPSMLDSILKMMGAG
ncbi:hypothetical protein JKP88DRAFT_207715 [Tribonema minus]|uniref:Uncharacterized protein n=1 Tax=Tribonema minus TaxID=303371 RepID=A0A835ZB05_9STRA|nr:hypothetical protein JKP88DRAFT_207715 [Tribonema minus]